LFDRGLSFGDLMCFGFLRSYGTLLYTLLEHMLPYGLILYSIHFAKVSDPSAALPDLTSSVTCLRPPFSATVSLHLFLFLCCCVVPDPLFFHFIRWERSYTIFFRFSRHERSPVSNISLFSEPIHPEDLLPPRRGTVTGRPPLGLLFDRFRDSLT